MMNERPTIFLICAAIGAATLFSACSKSQEAATPQSSLPATTRASIDEVVAAYDVVRGALSEDRGDVKAQALELADAARAGSGSAPEVLRRPLEDLSSAAQRLAELGSTDLSRAREGFGDVSRALISVLSAEPSLQQGRHVYECPMAKGYKKWVQVSEKVSNPYMGREMLQCGTEAPF